MNNDLTSNSENRLTGAEEAEFQDLLDKARQADRQRSVDITTAETEGAYQSVKPQIEANTPSVSYFKFAAAAIILIGLIGVGLTLMPHHVEVPNGATETVQLAGGSTVMLNSGSVLTYPRWYNMWNRTVELEGEAYFDVTQNGKPFTIETENAVINVMGTAFNVKSRSEENRITTSVFLKEGKLSFASKRDDDEAIILEPGQFSTLTGDQLSPTPPLSADTTKAMAWLSNGLSFSNQPLNKIFEEISRRFDVKIEAENRQLLQETLTIYISEMEDAEQTLTDICRAKNLQYVKKGDTFIISRKQ